MEGWLGNNQGKKILLKEKTKKHNLANNHENQLLDVNEVEEVEDYNERVEENPFQSELINMNELKCKNLLGGISSDSLGIVAFLAAEIVNSESLEEKDEPWEFKTLKNEISSVISTIYESKGTC